MTELRFDPRDELVCVGAEDDAAAHGGAMLPPIVQASLFRQPDMASLYAGLADEIGTPVYSRGTNPTVAVLEARLAALERGEACKCFASGMGAISAVLTGLLETGDHVLFVGTIYGPTLELARRLEGFGIAHSWVFDGDLAAIEAAFRPQTRIVYMESPGTALFGLLPIAAICDLARSRSALSVLDNSVATPLLQKPLELGVDVAVHSCSKYIGGHSDLVGGAAIGPRVLIERVFSRSFMLLGAVMAPFTAFLCLRGLMTLPVRMTRHAADAEALAAWLTRHGRVRRVYHPALANDPLFADQMRAHSGLFSFEIDGGFDDAVAIADRLALFGKAISWGGPESLVMTGHKADPGPAAASPVPASLVRLSIGFEGVEALQADLERALA